MNLDKLDFSNSIFSKNKEFEWKFCARNAKQILYYASTYTNIFDILCDCESLTGDLNFYNLKIYVDGDLIAVYQDFSKTNEVYEQTNAELCLDEEVDQLYKNLSISNWPYDKIIGSCIFCVLEDSIMNNSLNKKQIVGLRFIINNLTHLVLIKYLNSIFLSILNETKIFECAQIECLIGFQIYFSELRFFNYNFINTLTRNSLKYSLEIRKSQRIFVFFRGYWIWNRRNYYWMQ